MAKTRTDILNILLSADLTKIKLPEKQVKIERLSEDLGVDVVFTCRAIAPDKMEEIQENAMKIIDGEPDLDVTEMQIFTVIEGVKDPNLKDRELREKFGALTPKELVNKLLLPGEISRLYRIISDLSGFGNKAVTEVKN